MKRRAVIEAAFVATSTKFFTWPGATSWKESHHYLSRPACPLLVTEIVALVLSLTSAISPFLSCWL